jgi:hypothetical protein
MDYINISLEDVTGADDLGVELRTTAMDNYVEKRQQQEAERLLDVANTHVTVGSFDFDAVHDIVHELKSKFVMPMTLLCHPNQYSEFLGELNGVERATYQGTTDDSLTVSGVDIEAKKSMPDGEVALLGSNAIGRVAVTSPHSFAIRDADAIVSFEVSSGNTVSARFDDE